MSDLTLQEAGSGKNFNGHNPPLPISITDELRTSFRDYSMSVIVGRALPDVRDGLKPVHRRILYAMHSEGLLSNKKFSKCAGVVGEVLKKYHPHGDMSVYDALVRMAQNWSMRETLIDGQGNFGSVDGDPAAAYRYTEARLAKIAEELLRDIKENTVNFSPNFDGAAQEPDVLPTRVPNLLINGSEGIAVAMATKCPPHNLGEVVTAILAIIAEQYFDGPPIDDTVLNQIVPGPDFPTGGIICGNKGCLQANQTGRGSIVVRGRAEVEIDQKGREKIVIDQIPYQVNKARLLERIAALVREKRIEGVSDLHDESDRDGMRIVVDVRRGGVSDVILNQLYQHTPLQSHYSTHFLAITNGQPKTFSLRGIIDEFIAFRREVVTRRSRFRLAEHEKKFHLLTGIVTALDDINRVVTIIRSSQNTNKAKTKLMAEKFTGMPKTALLSTASTPQIGVWLKQGFASLDEMQANAILEMRLARLVALEREKLIGDCQEILDQIAELRRILGNTKVLMEVIQTELKEIKDKYSTPRRTIFVNSINQLTDEDLIPEEDMLVTISHQGYMKRSLLSSYKPQRRGGKGKQAVAAKDEDFIADAFVASTHAYLLTFTSKGRVFWVKVHELSQAGPQSKGRPIVNLIQLGEDEKVRAILPVRKFPDKEGESFVVTCTKRGKIKKSDLRYYANPRTAGLIACGIENEDELIAVHITNGADHLLLSTKQGMAIRFDESDARVMGRQAAGVRGISLKPQDQVVSMEVVDNTASIFTVTEYGYGKRTAISQYRKQTRGGIGLITIKCDTRNGQVADAMQVLPTDSAMIVTNKGKLIRMNVDGVSKIGRNTKGVRLISVTKDRGERVTSVTRLAEEEPEVESE